MRLFAMTCGWLTLPLGGLLEGEEGQLKVPVPCYLIDHPRGKVLFDSGLHPDAQHDPHGRLGAVAALFGVHFEPGEDVTARLEALHVDPREVRYLVNSHLHFDHCGANTTLPGARVVVQRREWEAGHTPETIESNFYAPRDYDTGQDVLQADGEHDLFGDGRVVCWPSPGHTPGHQSLRLRLDSGEVVLAGDACYLRRTLDEMHLPAIAHDRESMLDSLRRLRVLRDAGARIFYGHDPELWATVPQGEPL